MKELRSEKSRSVLNSNLNRNFQALASNNKHKISSFLQKRNGQSISQNRYNPKEPESKNALSVRANTML
tara:strand:- start:209 stop:415 length:207 start_codon:yes stop_codon:yes gene_type:complete